MKPLYEQYLEQRDAEAARMLKWERWAQAVCWACVVILIFLGGL